MYAKYIKKNKLSFMSQEGRNEIHKIAERHYYHLVNASLYVSTREKSYKKNWHN